MTLQEIEVALQRARSKVFSEDEQVAKQAEEDIARLRRLLRAHPDEVKRRDRIRAAQDERFLFRWL